MKMRLSYDVSQADGDLGFEAERYVDGQMVSIGSAIFFIPDAVIYGE